MKPLPYEAILSLEEAIIREFFPKGVIQVGKGDRWQPAEKKADRTLARLLRDKRDRAERPRFLAASSAHKLRWDKKLERWVPLKAHPDQDIGYTDTPYGAMRPDAGEAVDEESQKRFSKEAGRRFNEDREDEVLEMQAKLIATKIAKLQREGARFGVDLAPRLQALLKEGQQEIVQQRRSAA